MKNEDIVVLAGKETSKYCVTMALEVERRCCCYEKIFTHSFVLCRMKIYNINKHKSFETFVMND